jgi:hypothetical protein
MRKRHALHRVMIPAHDLVPWATCHDSACSAIRKPEHGWTCCFGCLPVSINFGGPPPVVFRRYHQCQPPAARVDVSSRVRLPARNPSHGVQVMFGYIVRFDPCSAPCRDSYKAPGVSHLLFPCLLISPYRLISTLHIEASSL